MDRTTINNSPVMFPNEKRLGNCLCGNLFSNLTSDPRLMTAIQYLAKGLDKTSTSPSTVKGEVHSAMLAARSFSPSPTPLASSANETFRNFVAALNQCSLNKKTVEPTIETT
jgi:hypothetical protein